MGNPIDDAAQARINDKIQDVVKTFGTEFSKAYTQVVLAKAKADLEPEHSLEDDLKLQTAPIPSAVLKTGMLVKRGESVKNWKPRYFVAYNAKDNYRIDYHDGTSETGKVKGNIFCAGYYAREFDADDIAEHGEPGIKLVPWSWRRRTWWIKCADEKERKEWLSVFETACYKSRPPHDEDECIAEAFNIALRNTRWRFWYWGWYGDAGNEAERLGEFLLDVLDRDIINEILSGIADGPAKNVTVDLVRKTVGTSVKAACASAWVSAAGAVRSISEKIQQQVKECISPVIEKQRDFKAMIVDKIGGTINPFLADKGAAVLRPILNVIFKPVIKAFTEAAKGFHSHMASKIQANEFASSKFDSTLERCDWQMDWWRGPIHAFYNIIWKMYTSSLSEVLSLLSGGITPYTIYNMCMDKVKEILHRAVFTFGQLAKSVSESEHTSALSHTTGLLLHDCFIMVKSTIMEVLTAILDAPIQEMVVQPAQQMVAPIQETIDAIPIPGLPMLLDLPTMLQEVVGSIEEGALEALISGSLGDIKSSLEALSLEIGVSGLAISD